MHGERDNERDTYREVQTRATAFARRQQGLLRKQPLKDTHLEQSPKEGKDWGKL